MEEPMMEKARLMENRSGILVDRRSWCKKANRSPRLGDLLAYGAIRNLLTRHG